MRIIDPILAPDVSDWCDHINPKEFEDGGCGSVVVGLYPAIDSNGKKVLSTISRQHCVDVATKSKMVLQAYFWDDIILDPIRQADWVIQTIQTEGLPIKWIWIDQEQWWTDWTAWQQARGNLIPMSSVPKGSPANISSHFERFNREIHSQLTQSGVYTNKGFVSSWAPGMDTWLPQYRSWVPHYGRQPKETTQMTWAAFKENWLPNYEIILSMGQKPELVAGHQFTGDACILPGSYSRYNKMLTLDVNVFSKAFIDSIRGGVPNPEPEPPAPPPPPQPPPGTVDYVVIYARVNVRASPSGDAVWVRYAVKDEVLHVVKIENNWAELFDGTYIFAAYIQKVKEDTPPPTPDHPQPSGDAYKVLYTRINVRGKTILRFDLDPLCSEGRSAARGEDRKRVGAVDRWNVRVCRLYCESIVNPFRPTLKRVHPFRVFLFWDTMVKRVSRGWMAGFDLSCGYLTVIHASEIEKNKPGGGCREKESMDAYVRMADDGRHIALQRGSALPRCESGSGDSIHGR